MPRLRFETARDVFDAFPEAKERLRMEPTDEPSLRFLDALGEQAVDKAIAFCAYLLPRREAVWWGCRSVQVLSPPAASEELATLAAAEEWVKNPEEERRLAALRVGQAGNTERATTWLALAAGWAGSSMPFEGKSVPLRADQTAKAVGAAILIAASRCEPNERTERLMQCVRDGARLTADGEQPTTSGGSKHA